MTDFRERVITIVERLSQLADELRGEAAYLRAESCDNFANDVQRAEEIARVIVLAWRAALEGHPRPAPVPIEPPPWLRERLQQHEVSYVGGPSDGQPAVFLPGLPDLTVRGASGRYVFDGRAYRWHE